MKVESNSVLEPFTEGLDEDDRLGDLGDMGMAAEVADADADVGTFRERGALVSLSRLVAS